MVHQLRLRRFLRCIFERLRAGSVINRNTELRVDAVEGPGEGDGFANVVEAAEPGHDSLDAHAEAGVGDAAVFAQVEVPLEGGERQVVLFDAGLE